MNDDVVNDGGTGHMLAMMTASIIKAVDVNPIVPGIDAWRWYATAWIARVVFSGAEVRACGPEIHAWAVEIDAWAVGMDAWAVGMDA